MTLNEQELSLLNKRESILKGLEYKALNGKVFNHILPVLDEEEIAEEISDLIEKGSYAEFCVTPKNQYFNTKNHIGVKIQGYVVAVFKRDVHSFIIRDGSNRRVIPDSGIWSWDKLLAPGEEILPEEGSINEIWLVPEIVEEVFYFPNGSRKDTKIVAEAVAAIFGVQAVAVQ